MRQKGLRLNKKCALEMLLGDAIRKVAGLEKPTRRVQSVTKYEPGNNRLLLSGDLVFYVQGSRVIASGCPEHAPAPVCPSDT